jgi:hypothetical protein
MPSYTHINGKKEPYDEVSKVFVVPLKEFLDSYPLIDVATKIKLIRNHLEIALSIIKNRRPSRPE